MAFGLMDIALGGTSVLMTVALQLLSVILIGWVTLSLCRQIAQTHGLLLLKRSTKTVWVQAVTIEFAQLRAHLPARLGLSHRIARHFMKSC